MSDISFDNLSVVFPDGTVGLDSITLDIASGEFVALVGPSGSGKTTLLRTLAGFIPASSGTVSLDGADVSAVPPERRQMGMVFQQHAVWPHMDVAANVAYPLQRAGLSRAEQRERVEETLETVGLAGYGKRKPSTLSGGQRQRVALARAIVAKPKVLLLDEALSALDEPLRDSLRRELVALTRQSSLTTVHVTHDRKEAIAIADRIAVLHDGRLEQFDTPATIVSRPATPWVASFIADAALLDGDLAGDQVHTAAPSFAWRTGEVTVVGEGSAGPVTVAVLPEAVTVARAGESAGAGARVAQLGTVTSVLFEVTGYSITVHIEGVEFRARTGTGFHPEVGQRVAVTIENPLVYPRAGR
ncbi:ABC transporter ATP-binding protein [Corynebacterium sp. TA-R-1]|uniref:ABC transporter ATP-binding protein n=1 Tax=Corynebacterium stercoris TaxID=2943490 RepID=A0ABT1G3I5_9CORY|nr:ABC transporter ATP-binding protein [Corynebacterium stercoris]MCP1388579.1 ABC transporter ATP-binding protein [Corynebacterium stercoris]